MIEIDETRSVHAPKEILWEVVTDLERYGEWNPFVVACASTLRVGDPIDMKVQIFEAFAQPQRETVFEHIAGQSLCYGVSPMPFGALESRRCHHIAEADDGGSTYRSHFVLSGWLGSVTEALLGARLRDGFAGMTRALVQRAELLAEERREAAEGSGA